MRPKEWRLWASLCGTHDLRNLSFVSWKIDQGNFPIFIKALVSADGVTQSVGILPCIFCIIYASRDQKDWIQVKISYKISCENANILFIPVTVSCCAIFEWCMYETVHLSEIFTYQILIKILNQIAVCCTINMLCRNNPHLILLISSCLSWSCSRSLISCWSFIC